MSPAPPLWTGCGQVAMSVLDVDATVAFYERAFGYGRNGGFDRLFNGRTTDTVLGYKDVRHRLRWMSDQDPRFQLELVQFQNPPARALPDTRPSDLGYCRMSLWVERFDDTLDRLRSAGVPLLTPPRDYGDGRRVCCRDPNGVLLELLERDIALPSGARTPESYDLPVRTRAVSLSVPSLGEAEAYFGGLLGMRRAEVTLHTPAMEELWGLAGTTPRSAVYWAGDHLLELCEYPAVPGRARPPARQLGDLGIYHIALRFEDRRAVDSTYQAARASGFGSNSAPVDLRVAKLVYLHAPCGSWVEGLYYHPFIGRFIGYRRQELR